MYLRLFNSGVGASGNETELSSLYGTWGLGHRELKKFKFRESNLSAA